MKRLLPTLVVAAGLFVAPSVLAADEAPGGIAAKGNLILSADRLFGLSFNSVTTERESSGTTVKSTTSNTDFGLLWGIARSPYTIPRAGIDFTVIDGLTVGGSVGFFTGSGKQKSEANGVSQERDGASITALLIAPRVGYLIPLSDTMAIWVRGGITYFSLSTSSESTSGTPAVTTKSTNTDSGVALTLDPSFVITPVSHFGFYAGVVADVAVSGTDKSSVDRNGITSSTENKQRYNNFGLAFGLLGYL